MKFNYNYKVLIQWSVFLFALFLPFFVIRFFPKFYHTSDVDDFWRWSQAWGVNWRNIYLNCERCNYPFFGTLVSGGVINVISSIVSHKQIANYFRSYLAIVDAINVLLIWLILRNLQVKNSPLWAGIIGLLPSSWIGSSVWGQIDGINQFLVLIFLNFLIWFNAKPKTSWHYYAALSFAGFLLALLVLTKQLIYFSVVGLLAILFVNIVLYSPRIKKILTSFFTVLLFFCLPIIFLDLILKIKDPYFSHLQYILLTGSQHGNIISSLGLNIWVFFVNDFSTSSKAPLHLGNTIIDFISPYSVGIGLFILFNIILFVLFIKDLLHKHHQSQVGFNTDQIASAIFYLSLINLSFNLMLTGTHERYLYHFYPYAIISCLGLMRNSKIITAKLLFWLIPFAIAYGMYLCGYLTGDIRGNSYLIIRIMTFANLILFTFLIYSWIKSILSVNLMLNHDHLI